MVSNLILLIFKGSVILDRYNYKTVRLSENNLGKKFMNVKSSEKCQTISLENERLLGCQSNI